MKLLNLSLTILAAFSIVGCVAIDQSVPKATVISTVSETALQICRAASENNVRANSLYANKMFSTTGEVRTVNEGFQPRYRVYLRSGNVAIHAGTENKIGVSQLTVGKTVRASGIITAVSNDYSGCSISLKDATF